MLRKVTFALLCLFIFFVPLENLLVFESLGSSTRALGLLTFVVAVLSVAASGRVRSPNAIILLAIVFFVWTVVGNGWARSRMGAAGAIVTQGQLIGMLWLIWEFTPSPRSQQRLMGAYVTGCLFTAFQTILSYAQGSGTYSQAAGRAVAEGFNPNSVGLLLGLSIPMAAYLVCQQKNALLAWFFRGHCALAAFAILLTGSRGALVAASAGIILLPWSVLAPPKRRNALAVTLVAALALIVLFVPPKTWERLGTLGESVTDGGLNGRSRIWRAGLQVFQDHPIIGIGPNSFRRAVAPILGEGQVAHNGFLAVLVEQGLIGFSLYLMILAHLVAIIMRLPMLERRVSLALLACWTVGAMSSNLDQSHKVTWLVISIIATQAVLMQRPQVQAARRFLYYRAPMQPQDAPTAN